MNDPETFKYFAFISYSRKDSRAAAFLHRKLEKFRIPIKRVPEEMRRGLHKFVRPVFRDKRDLEVGESSFTEDVKRALEESRFIIVLCSPNSARSAWVDNEIRYFLSTHGGDLSKVVPVVLAGNPGSGDAETECLSECLLSEKVRPAIVNRNLPTMVPDDGEPEKCGWEAGTVGVLSYLLKVKRMDIKSTMDAEKMRQMRIYAAIGIACSAVFAALTFWAVGAERDAKRNWRLAEANEKRAVAGEKEAREKAYLAEQTVDFLRRMLQEAKPDEHGAKNVIDLLTEQQSKVDLLDPPELRYSVSLVLGQVLLEQSLAAPASRLLKYAYDFSKSRGKTDELTGAANMLAVAYNQMSGHSDEALALLAEVEELKRVAGSDDVSMASTVCNMAAAYFVKGDFARSRELCDKALALIGDKPCPAGLLALGQNARIAIELGDYKQAEAYCERLFQMCEALKTEPDPDQVEVYVLTCYRLGKYTKGKKLAEETLDKVRKSGGDARALVLLENDLGLIKVDLGDVQGAIVNYQNAIRESEKIWPDGQVATKANIYNNLGAAYLAVGGAHRAVPIFKKAVEMLESHGDGDSDGLFLPLVNLGLAYRQTGEREKALAIYERAYGICVKKTGPDSMHLATVIDHIAGVKEELGAKSEAKVGFEEVLRILEKNNSLNTPLAVSAMGGLAELQFSSGEKEKAWSTISNAVELARTILPPGNVLRGNIMRAYETIRQGKPLEVAGLSGLEKSWSAKKKAASRALDDNRNDEARALYLEMLRHLDETGQTLTQEYALVCNQLGILASRNEDPASALAYYTKSRDIHFSISGTNDIEVAIPCYNAATVLEELGDLGGAEQAFMRALPAYEAESKDTLSLIYTKLGRIKERQKRLAEALAWHRKALAIDASLKGTNSLYVAVDRENIGNIHKENGEYAAAVTNYKAAVAVRLLAGEPPDSAKMCKLENDIAVALHRDGKVRMAAEHYRRAYELGLHNFGLTNITTVTVLANLGSCEKDLGEYAGAIEHLALAADMKKSMSEFDAHSFSLTVNDLAIAYGRNGDSDKAIQTLNVALKYALRAWGRENEEVMTIYGNIAFEYERSGKADEAIGYYRKALDIALLLHGNAGERTRQYYRDLGDCLYKAGKYDKCAAIRKTYLDAVREVGTLGPEYAAKAHMLYSDALWALDDYAGSASNRACAVEAYRTCGEGYLESVAVSLCKLGYALRSLGEFKSAAEAFSEAKRIFENANLAYEKGGDVDLGIHQKLEESRRLASGQLRLVIKMTKITEGGQADRLGAKKGDVWCSLDEWKADDYPDGKGLWDSLVKAMAHFQEKPRQLTVWRLDNGEWKKKTFQFDGSLGEFTYGYDVLSAENFHAMKASCK